MNHGSQAGRDAWAQLDRVDAVPLARAIVMVVAGAPQP